MHSFILQDWTSIRGGTSVSTITQQETEWLDLGPYQDIVAWVDVKETMNNGVAGGSPTLLIQTSPILEDAFFQSMLTVTMTAAAAPAVLPAMMSSATLPLARYLRWQIVGTPAWDATFRIAIAANSPGM